MMDHNLQDLMRRVTETENFRPLFAHFSDNVELRVTMALASSARSERRGKPSVIRHLQVARHAVQPRIEEPIEFFVDGERFVACHDKSVAAAVGLNLRCERTLVFDVHEGFVTRIAIHYELSPAAEHPAAALAVVTANETKCAAVDLGYPEKHQIQ
jgi:hypothetical protein